MAETPFPFAAELAAPVSSPDPEPAAPPAAEPTAGAPTEVTDSGEASLVPDELQAQMTPEQVADLQAELVAARSNYETLQQDASRKEQILQQIRQRAADEQFRAELSKQSKELAAKFFALDSEAQLDAELNAFLSNFITNYQQGIQQQAQQVEAQRQASEWEKSRADYFKELDRLNIPAPLVAVLQTAQNPKQLDEMSKGIFAWYGKLQDNAIQNAGQAQLAEQAKGGANAPVAASGTPVPPKSGAPLAAYSPEAIERTRRIFNM